MRRFALLMLLGLTLSAQSPSESLELQRRFWSAVKESLSDSQWPRYWETVKDALLPGPIVGGTETLRATVVASRPALNPTEVVVAISDDHTPEVTLRLFAKPGVLPKSILPGTVIEFAGTAKTFEHDPFMLTFDVEVGPQKESGLRIVKRAGN
jgi:hypothetical protein